MPVTPNNGFDAERFAALMARLDTGNASEAEAMAAARAMRHMATAAGLRIVDVLGRADVIAALDAQMKPVKEDSRELREAFSRVAELAELVAAKDEVIAGLQSKLAAAGGPHPALASVDTGPVSRGLFWLVVIFAALLMIASAFR
jgi:hypothetical protein